MPDPVTYPRPRETALNRELGREIHRARIRANMPRLDLAEAMDLTAPTLAAVEEGVAPLSASRAIEALELAGIDPLTALARALAATTEPGRADHEGVRLLVHHARLTPELQCRVRDLVVSAAGALDTGR